MIMYTVNRTNKNYSNKNEMKKLFGIYKIFIVHNSVSLLNKLQYVFFIYFKWTIRY